MLSFGCCSSLFEVVCQDLQPVYHIKTLIALATTQ
jgi:hypothetical protein